MVAQETMNSNGRTPPLTTNLSGFARDVVTLTELQFKLLAVDCRDAKAAAGRGLLLLGAGCVFAIAVVPVLLASAAYALVEVAGWSRAAAFATSALLSAGLACLTGFLGWRRMQTATSAFQRSRAEIKETVHWIKESLRHEASEAEVLSRRM
jgi:uncharacterized membrane protein YqjE